MSRSPYLSLSFLWKIQSNIKVTNKMLPDQWYLAISSARCVSHTLGRASQGNHDLSGLQSELKAHSGKLIILSQKKNVEQVLGLSLSSRTLVHVWGLCSALSVTGRKKIMSPCAQTRCKRGERAASRLLKGSKHCSVRHRSLYCHRKQSALISSHQQF